MKDPKKHQDDTKEDSSEGDSGEVENIEDSFDDVDQYDFAEFNLPAENYDE